MRLSAFVVLASLLAGSSIARADSGFAVRARPGGLDFVAAAVKDKVPTHFDVPEITDPVTLTGGEADVEIHSVALTPRAGAIDVDVSLDLIVGAHLDAGFTECDIDVYARPVDLSANLMLTTTADGRIEATALGLDVGLTAAAFDLDIEGCVLGDVVESILEAVEDWALDKATELLEDVAAREILPRLQEAIESFTALELDVAGFELVGRIERLELDPSTGLTAYADGHISWAGDLYPGLADIAEPTTEPAIGAALPASYGPADFALAASDDRVTQALYQAWRGGIFHQFLADVSPSLELDGEGLAQKLGLPAGTTVDVGIALGAPPMITFGRGPDATGVRINLVNLELTATITAPGAAPSVVEILVHGQLTARVSIDPAVGALRVEPTDLAITGLDIVAGPQSLDVDPARLREFVRAVAVPMVGDMLAGIPIAPALNPLDDIFAIARDVTTDGGWLRVAIDVVRPDPNDAADPDTSLVRPPAIVSPALTRFAVTGTDDTTPPELLRYMVKLDGELVTDEPGFMSQVSVSAAEGNHLLEVWSIDLGGREDRTPVVHSFYVDGTPPELLVSQAPPPVVEDREIFAVWTASDDRTPVDAVETRWELRRVGSGDARGEVIASDDFVPGRLQVAIGDLDEDALYVLEIVARDEAGNVTSTELGFSVHPGGNGCSAGGTGAGLWFLLFVTAALLIRRHHRGALAVAFVAGLVGGAAPASAQGVGTTLSGPTDGDGASAFWNPAAMMRARGTSLEIGSGLSMIRAEYVPMDSAAGSRTFVPKPEPTVGMVTDAAGRRLRFGFTVGVPQIDGATWSRDDGAGDITRWYAASAKTFHVTITPAVAYAPAPWLSIGAGIDIVRSQMSADLDKDMGKQLNLVAGSTVPDSPFPYGDPAMAAPLDLEARGWTVGAVAGLLVRPHDRVSIGASLHVPTTTNARGAVAVEYPEAMRELVEAAAPAAELPELSGDIEVPLKLPLMTFAAVAVEPAYGWEVRADYRYLDRSEVADMNVHVTAATSEDVKDTALVRGYRDRHSFGLRASRLVGAGRGLVAARARFEPNGVPETTAAPNNLDFDKLELGVAGRYLMSRNVWVTVFYSHYFMAPRTVDDSLHQPLVEASLDTYNHPAPVGTYSATSDYVGFLLTVGMGS